MLRYASDQGFEISTLLYIDLELTIPPLEGEPSPEIPQELRARLEAINSKHHLPRASLLAAKIAANDGDDSRADALAAYVTRLTDENPTVSFKAVDEALILRGHLRHRVGDTKGAEHYFREAVQRYGSRRAALELLYDGQCPPQVVALTNAAVLGMPYDATKLSRAESEFAVKMLETGQKKRFLDHQYMAQEWLRLVRTKPEHLRDE